MGLNRPRSNDWSFGTRNSNNDKSSAMAETAAANMLPSTNHTINHKNVKSYNYFPVFVKSASFP